MEQFDFSGNTSKYVTATTIEPPARVLYRFENVFCIVVIDD